jgi:hypothetical protein
MAGGLLLMKTVPWWIWALVILGWLGNAANGIDLHASTNWFFGVAIVVAAFYLEKRK